MTTSQAKRIFIWVGHPAQSSLCDALADRYEAAARAAGSEVRRMNLADMDFDDRAFAGYDGKRLELEPDLKRWQDNMTWADHVLIVYPYWWGAMPGRMKSVLDRALLPGFAFKYKGPKSLQWNKLLEGKTGDVIITSDTPPLLDRLLYRKPGRRVISNQVLGFVGIKPRRVVQFGSVRTAKPSKIEGWLDAAHKLGERAAA